MGVGAGETLFATVRAQSASLMAFLNGISVRERCGDAVCLAEGSAGVAGVNQLSIAWTNVGATRPVIVVLEERLGFDRALATVTFRVVPPATNSQCASALPLTIGEAREANLPSASDSWPPCWNPRGLQALYYTVTIPARSTLEVSAQPFEGLLDAADVRIFGGCDASTCLAHAANATYVNRGEETRVVVAVSGTRVDGRSRFLARVVARVRSN